MADIVLTGLASTDPVPGVYLEINFAVGPGGGTASPREILVLGNKIAAGTGTASTVVYGPDTEDPLQDEGDAIRICGQGSEAHLMLREIYRINKNTAVRLLLVPEGGSSVAATGTITYTSAATANGTTRVYVSDEFVDVPFLSGDSVTSIATAVVAAINANLSWPVTAANTAGVVTITAKNGGLRGNFHMYQAKVFGTGIATTVTPSADTAMTGGSVADALTTPLATILGSRYYYIVAPQTDATSLGLIVTQVGNQATPTTGIRQYVQGAHTGTLAAGITLATTINAVRAEIGWQEQSPLGPARLAAKFAAVYSLEELATNPKTNFCGYGNDANTQPRWSVPAARSVGVRPSRASIKSALLNGMSAVGTNSNASTYIVNAVTTRTLNGATPDYRISRHHKRFICDAFSDDLVAKTVLQYSGRRIGDDPKQGDKVPGPQVITPKIYKGAVFRLIDDYAENDLFQNVPTIKSSTIVQRQVSNRAQLAVSVDLQPCDNSEQFALSINQVA